MGKWRRVLSGITISRKYASCSARVIQGCAVLAWQYLRDCKAKNAACIDFQGTANRCYEYLFRGDFRREPLEPCRKTDKANFLGGEAAEPVLCNCRSPHEEPVDCLFGRNCLLHRGTVRGTGTNGRRRVRASIESHERHASNRIQHQSSREVRRQPIRLALGPGCDCRLLRATVVDPSEDGGGDLNVRRLCRPGRGGGRV